jgi:hypothetical protein
MEKTSSSEMSAQSSDSRAEAIGSDPSDPFNPFLAVDLA